MTDIGTLPDLDFVLAEDPPTERTIHIYPVDPRYCLSGAGWPQIGDIALCGFVKREPPNPYNDWPTTCPRCARLDALS